MNQKVRRAAAVIITRGSGHEVQVYLIQRAHSMRFMGGFWAFPGGNVSRSDQHDGDADERDAVYRCAARELWEETGLIATSLGNLGLEHRHNLTRTTPREEPQRWNALIEQASKPVDWFSAVCEITTPEFSPVRFETDFVHAQLHADETPQVDGSECIDGRFVRPAQVVESWERGEILVAPPVLFLLRVLARDGLEGFAAAARNIADEFERGGLHPVTFTPGFFVAPLRTPTLPPATTTNTIIVGQDRLYIFDPGTPDPQELESLCAELDQRLAAGARLEAIVLTHHHPDHVGCVDQLSARYELPVRAHPLCFDRVAGEYLRGETLNEGDRLDLGQAPDGRDGWYLDVLHTPGHAVDHLCFIDNYYGGAVVGDMCSTISSILIEPPEGHLRTYLESLERLLDTGMTTLYPAHGIPDAKGKDLVRQYLEHRAEREDALLAALGDTPRSAQDLVPEIYTDVPEQAWPLAARALSAGLIKLAEDGKAREQVEGWVKLVA